MIGADLVNARDAVSRRRGGSCASHNVDLSAPERDVMSVSERRAAVMIRWDSLHVQLGPTGRASSMQGNHLSPQQVLSRGNAGRDGYRMYAAVADNLGSAPVTSIVAILLDLEPTVRIVSAGPIRMCRVSSSRSDGTHHPLPTPVSVRALSTFFR